MRKLVALATAAILTFAASAWAQQEAKAPATLEGYVPVDAMLYVHYEGFTKAAATFKDTELLKMIEEPEVQAFGAELSRFMDVLIREKGGKDSVVEWPDLRLLMDSEMAYALLDVRGQIPAMALIVRPGDRADDLAKLVDKLIDKATQGNGAQIPEDQLEGGMQFKQVGPFCVAWTCGDLIITSGKETLRRISRTAKGEANGLVKNDRYAAAAKRFGQEKEFLTAYLDVERLREQTGDLRRAEKFEKFWDATGLKDVNYARLGVAAEPPGVKGTLYVHAPQGGSGLLKLIPTTPVDEKAMLATVDEKASDVCIARVNAAAAYDTIVEFAKAMSDEDRVNAELDDMTQALGFDLKKDLLASLGDEVSFRTLGSGLQFCASVNVKDEKAAAAAVEKLVAAVDAKAKAGGKGEIEIEKLEHKGREIVAIKITGAPLPVTPSYAFAGGKLILATTPQALKTAIDLLGAQPARPLVASDAWKSVRSHVAAKPAVLAWAETKEGFGAAYGGVLTPLVQMLNGAKGNIPENSLATKFPRAEAITPHLFASVTALSRDGEGWLVESYGPACSLTSGVSSLGIVMGVTLPAIAKARESARRAACMNNLHQIGMAMEMYAVDEGGGYPKTFGAILKKGYIKDTRVFRCPSTGGPGRGVALADPKNMEVDAIDKALADATTYVFVPGAPREKDSIIVHDGPGAHSGEGRCCLFGDGHVEWLAEAEFQKKIAEQRQRLGEKNGEAEK